MATDPRRIALRILNELDTGDKTLDALIDASYETVKFPEKRDRALMQALVYGVLRYRSRIDEIISHFSNTALRKIKPKVLNVLRLALFQIIYMDRIPNSAAVNTSVEMAKSVSAQWTVRFVNAVLRKASAGPLPPSSGGAVEKSIPGWLFSRWKKRFGESGTDMICNAVNSIPPITIRTNTLQKSRKELLTDFHGNAEEISATEFSPEGISFANPKGAVSDMPGFMNGDFQVQDEAAQLAGHILAPKPGETVLDACAGLGGKTGHTAQLMRNRGELYAVDKESQKLKKLKKEMQRLGISIVETFCHDLSSRWRPRQAPFDRILLDAPCSGLGVLRRNPDAKWSVSEKDLFRLHDIQIRLLENLAPLLKPSGIIVYVVCSTEPEETESVVEAFLKSNPNFQPEPLHSLKLLPSDCITEKGFFRTYPNRLSMDGFFSARLKRIN